MVEHVRGFNPNMYQCRDPDKSTREMNHKEAADALMPARKFMAIRTPNSQPISLAVGDYVYLRQHRGYKLPVCADAVLLSSALDDQLKYVSDSGRRLSIRSAGRTTRSRFLSIAQSLLRIKHAVANTCWRPRFKMVSQGVNPTCDNSSVEPENP
jgi:hypothetical protein